MIKRVSKLLISLIYFFVTFLYKLFLRFIGKELNGYCTILYYHSIPDQYRKKFAKQMDLLLKFTQPVDANHNTGLNKGIIYSAVTFDDGFLSVMKNGVPELNKRNIPYTIFLPADNLGENPNWEMKLKSEEQVMNKLQLEQISNNLLIFGSHTLTHPDLTSIPENIARKEIKLSKRKLETALKLKINLFSFPHGAYNQNLINIALDTGYARVFTIEPRKAFLSKDEKVSGRVSVGLKDYDIEFILKLFGAYNWLGKGSELKTKVFRSFHNQKVHYYVKNFS